MLILTKPAKGEWTAKNSRFLSEIVTVTTPEEAREIWRIRKTQYDNGGHIVYAFMAGPQGNIMGCSDDGEPSGTAGQPIMEALKNSGLKETLVAVVRWFGGIKLGAGGLVRAYSSSASSAIKNAAKVRYELCDVYALNLDFARAKKFASVAARSPFDIIGTEYGESVRFMLTAEEGLKIDALVADAIGGKPDLEKVETRFIERPETEK